MGSIKNCDFVYDGLVELGEKLRTLYENDKCDFLALSSVGPAFFILVNDESKKNMCIEKLNELGMDIIHSRICNSRYIIVSEEKNKNFWKNEKTGQEFRQKVASKYITDVIDKINIKNKKCIDIGAGGGRYSNYLKDSGAQVLAIDKNSEMFGEENNKKINFIECSMDNIPVLSGSYYLALSIGVLHNATTIKEYKDSLEELYRILEPGGKAIISVFTNEIITDDLIKCDDNLYQIKDRNPMVLLSKQQVDEYVSECGFKILNMIDEHITDVGGGKRNVYSIFLEKEVLHLV